MESLAADFLVRNGLKILKRNFKSYRGGEIDIVAAESDGTLVFAEVKFRSSKRQGLAEEAVTMRKQRMICAAADYYTSRFRVSADTNVRFDVIAINSQGSGAKIDWYKNAFEYIGRG